MRSFSEVIQGTCPSKSNGYRIAQNRLIKSPALKTYESNFYIQCKSRGANIAGYFKLQVNVFYPNQRADLDNALKVILDCMQACRVIKNDNKCVGIKIDKFLDPRSPRVEFVVSEVGFGEKASNIE